MPAFLNQTPDVRTIIIHDENLRAAAAIRGKCEFMTRSRVPCRRDVHRFADGQAPQILAIPVGYIDFRAAAVAAARQGEPASSGRPAARYGGPPRPIQRIRASTPGEQEFLIAVPLRKLLATSCDP